MPISQVSVLYPEYASQLAVINDLKIDIDKGMPETLIQQYYPELYAEAEAEATRGGGMKGAAAAMSPIDL